MTCTDGNLVTVTEERNYRVWTRYGRDEWQKIDFAYTESEARYNAKARQEDEPLMQFTVLPDGQVPPPDEPFDPSVKIVGV